MTNKLLKRLAYINWVCAAQFMIIVGAAAQGFDVEPPIIEHEVVESAKAADRQNFVATVADDNELDSVRFLYRLEGDSQYTSVEMNRVSFSSTFNVQIATDIKNDASIQYYIEARDVSGNRTLRGYNFSPLVRFIDLPPAVVAPVAEDAGPKFNRKPIYYVVGAVVLGALVGALASSGGSGSGGDTSTDGNCADGLCNFSFTISPPGQ